MVRRIDAVRTMIERLRFATIVLALAPSVGFSAASGDCGPGEGCAEPCPAENSCFVDSECGPGMACKPWAPGLPCHPSECSCDAGSGTWTCTTDCGGTCTQWGQCLTDEDCDDGNLCTIDHCNPISYQCDYLIMDPCCPADGVCYDGDPCTLDWSCGGAGQCDYPPMPDGTTCGSGPYGPCGNRDTCQNGSCLPECPEPCPVDGCHGDSECPPGWVCDLSACIPSVCECQDGGWTCTTDCAPEVGACVLIDCGDPPSTETNCDDGVDNDCDGLVDGADPDCAAPTFLIGGALFADCTNPFAGVAGVTVNVSCDDGFADSRTSTVPFGIWTIENVPEDTCIVTVECFFCSVDSVCPPDSCSNTVVIIVNAANQADNQSLGFWECVNLDCWFDFASCMTGPDVPYPSGCNVFDTDGDGDVDLMDAAAFQRAFTGAVGGD